MNPDDLSLDELRALVRRRRAAVTTKIARARRAKSVDLAGTQYDPRRETGITKKYTRAQLKKTLGSYEQFLDRRTQFVGDAERRPITAQQWKRYQQAERQLNAASAARREPFDNVQLPGKNMTFKEHRAATRPDFPTAGNPAVNDPYPTYNRTPSQVASPAKLEALIKGLRRRSRPAGYNKPLKDAKQVLNDMFDITGDEGMVKAIKGLNRKQFEYLWNVSGFAQAASTYYHLSKRAQEGHAQDWLDEVSENMADDAWGYIRDAKKIK